eukprot:CAMPEP_0172529266 /NCGR_PEP_ID=MMETSP1067-20121228/3389_1 /TAXON_ID=265564 ORGANISM="Thalassiosira punctigera, Strain Tpunct2005C2" /NCGR_SAMPLE_ID=MMETSP1067 /ASSEMBLY_ACC=CAM_ASM_000444 /LENGTH=162 /DNA_ID=CAMNT_0013313293 /DNA_START=79 /DNA_END=567 /DNA_ORIENTATION=+
MMKFAFVVVAMTSSVSTLAAGSRLGGSIFKENPFTLAEASEPRHCSAEVHNATACLRREHAQVYQDRIEHCLDIAHNNTDGNPCHDYGMCVAIEPEHEDKLCREVEEKLANCCNPPQPKEHSPPPEEHSPPPEEHDPSGPPTLDTPQVLKNVARVLKKNIRG